MKTKDEQPDPMIIPVKKEPSATPSSHDWHPFGSAIILISIIIAILIAFWAAF